MASLSSSKAGYFTYMLECRDQEGHVTYYTGSTDSLDRRVTEHRTSRGAKFTSGKDCKLVFYQSFPTRAKAMAREKFIKTLSRNKKEGLIKDVFVNEAIKDSLKGINHDM
nr:GIY-YIG nuclease family protein [Candidatus Sigynarchaeota archaeon]